MGAPRPGVAVAAGVAALALLLVDGARADSARAAGPRGGCERLQATFEAAAAEHGIDAALLAGIIQVETGFRVDVTSRSGARGPMQIMPSTGKAMGCADLDEPRANIACGARLVAGLLRRYEGRVLYSLAAYRLGTREPDRARRARETAALSYVDKVVAARARYVRGGCAGLLAKPRSGR